MSKLYKDAILYYSMHSYYIRYIHNQRNLDEEDRILN